MKDAPSDRTVNPCAGLLRQVRRNVCLLATLSFTLVAVSPASLTAQTVVPEPPAIWREVTGVRYSDPANPNSPAPLHYRSHVPAFRTSNDGRVALRVLPTVDFTLMMPEKLTSNPLLYPEGLAVANSYVMSSSQYFYVDANGNTMTAANHAKRFYVPTLNPATGAVVAGSIVHCALFDPFTPQGSANPQPLNGEDVYDLKVVGVFNFSNGTIYDGDIRLFVTAVKVYVHNPKTSAAYIRAIATETPIGGPIIPDVGGKEPTIIGGDGHLLVMRLGNINRTWQDPVSPFAMHTNQDADIIYSYYETGTSCDVNQWTALNMIPISHAPYDTRINGKFGFAMTPFRDPAGRVIPDGMDFGGTYPWMDRNGKNLFFTEIADTLYATNTNTHVTDPSRYPTSLVPGEAQTTYETEDASNTRGICFVGLWSNGKIVHLDNLNNDMDYSVSSDSMPVGSQRMVSLFAPGGLPADKDHGWLRLGAGRVNSAPAMPGGDNRNSTVIESLENRFNYNPFAKPLGFRDVIWPLNNAKQTDVVVFDDYLDPDVFINCSMAGLLNYDTTTTASNAKNMIYDNGWSSSSKTFSQTVRLQNAATAPSTRWAIPSSGEVISGGRVEPAAVGGVHGKGFWLTGSNGIRFSVPAQTPPQTVVDKTWYAGLFVDCRFDDDGIRRTLLTFPDGSKVRLEGRSQVVYLDAGGNTVNRIALPAKLVSTPVAPLDDLLPKNGWAHLAFQIRPGGGVVDFLLDGLLYNRWTDDKTSLFQMGSGSLVVGAPITTEAAFIGWIDDFKVIAHAMDAESACNHAGGTLIGFPASYTGDWKTMFGARFPAWTHAEITESLLSGGETAFAQYANFIDYTKDRGAHRLNIPAGTTPVGEAIHFPEGPLFHNAPRPDTVSNAFCLQCHHADGKAGLGLDALMVDALTNTSADLRRQPSQSAQFVSGNIPANYFAYGPSVAQSATQPVPLDPWTLPALTTPRTVTTFSLTNALTGRDLMTLANGAVVDPARFGTSQFAIRANLDAAQGSVLLTVGGTSTTVPSAPYLSPGQNFAPGSYTVTAAPQSGTAKSITFQVLGGTRVVGNLKNDFAYFSPAGSWTFEWNAAGAIGDPFNQRYLYWNPKVARYTGDGSATYPCVATADAANYAYRASFRRPNNGKCFVRPGRGASLAGGVERYAIAAYHVKLAGNYAIASSYILSTTSVGNGGVVLILKESGGVCTQVGTGSLVPASLTQSVSFDATLGTLLPGDAIYVCVGPNGTDGSDDFEMDFNIQVTTP